MAEAGFEFELERMFAAPPTMADSDVFALEVLSRLDRGWTARRLLIGVMGAVGGLIGGAEVLGSGALGQLGGLTRRLYGLIDQHLHGAAAAVLASTGLPIDNQVLWMLGALALIAAGLGAARLFREI